MKRRILELKRDYADKMREKFGQVIDIDELEEKSITENMGLKPENCIGIDEMEEALMKCLVHDLRLANYDIKGLYVEETKLWAVRFLHLHKTFNTLDLQEVSCILKIRILERIL